jgi:hypothetical protein
MDMTPAAPQLGDHGSSKERLCLDGGRGRGAAGGLYAYYRRAKAGPVKTLRRQRRLGGCGRLARGAEPIGAFLEAAVFEMVRRPAFA